MRANRDLFVALGVILACAATLIWLAVLVLREIDTVVRGLPLYLMSLGVSLVIATVLWLAIRLVKLGEPRSTAEPSRFRRVRRIVRNDRPEPPARRHLAAWLERAESFVVPVAIFGFALSIFLPAPVAFINRHFDTSPTDWHRPTVVRLYRGTSHRSTPGASVKDWRNPAHEVRISLARSMVKQLEEGTHVLEVGTRGGSLGLERYVVRRVVPRESAPEHPIRPLPDQAGR